LFNKTLNYKGLSLNIDSMVSCDSKKAALNSSSIRKFMDQVFNAKWSWLNKKKQQITTIWKKLSQYSLYASL